MPRAEGARPLVLRGLERLRHCIRPMPSAKYSDLQARALGLKAKVRGNFPTP